MSGYFTKLDAGITDSTVWREPDTTRLVWITLLSMADQNGYIGASVPGLADRARVSLDACLVALECFRQPDKWSRSQEYDGRRIADVDGGWVLLNHAKYRALRDAEVRKAQVRAAVSRFRAKPKDGLITDDYSKPCKPGKAQADTEADTTKQDQKPLQAAAKKRGTRLPDDWHLATELMVWATEATGNFDYVQREIEKFKDYWKACAGAKGVKLDWDATFRNWIRNALSRGSYGKQTGEGVGRSAIDRVSENVRRANQTNGYGSGPVVDGKVVGRPG